MMRVVPAIAAAAALGSGAFAVDPAAPKYDPNRAISAAMDAASKPVDPAAAAVRKSVDSRILVLGTNGAWSVEKEGNFNLNKPTATVIERDPAGNLAITQQGGGIKDRSAQRFSSDFAAVEKLLRQAQSFTYRVTDQWGTPEDLERYKFGDCMDKSVWLTSKLREAGFSDVKTVLGLPPGADTGHAWVEMRIGGEPYILETTTQEPPRPRAQAGPLYDSRYPTIGYFDSRGFHESPRFPRAPRR